MTNAEMRKELEKYPDDIEVFVLTEGKLGKWAQFVWHVSIYNIELQLYNGFDGDLKGKEVLSIRT